MRFTEPARFAAPQQLSLPLRVDFERVAAWCISLVCRGFERSQFAVLFSSGGTAGLSQESKHLHIFMFPGWACFRASPQFRPDIHCSLDMSARCAELARSQPLGPGMRFTKTRFLDALPNRRRTSSNSLSDFSGRTALLARNTLKTLPKQDCELVA